MKNQRLQCHLFYMIFVFIVFYTNQLLIAEELGYQIRPVKPPQNHAYIQELEKINSYDKNVFRVLKETEFLFLASVQVNSDSGNQINEFAPVIEVSKEGVIYIVWNGDETLKSIFFSRSLDGGKTFSAAIKINDDVNYPTSYSVYQPDITLDTEGAIYIVWHDYRSWFDDQSWTSPIDIYLDKSTDGGITWNTDKKVSNGFGTYPWHFQPYIAVDKNNDYIYVSFTDYDRYSQGDKGDISVSRSLDKALSFEDKIRVDDTADSLLVAQTFSNIAVDSVTSNVYVAFNDSRNGTKDIYLAKSTDYGKSFLNNTLVNTDTSNDQEEPSVKINRLGNVYVIWKAWQADPTPKESPYLNDIYIAKSIDNGNSFSSNVKINDEYLNAEYDYNFPPRLAIDILGNIHVTWFDFRYGYTNCFYDESIDGGQTFGADDIVHNNRDSLSHSLPRIAVDVNNVAHIVWMDKRNGNNMYDIFFSKKTVLTNINEISSISANFSLMQNYPNPFNPKTNISWQSSVGSWHTLKIYDVLGNHVATLVDEYKPAGRYQVEFAANVGTAMINHQLSSGIYFYQLNAGTFIQTRKMLLLK